jgi:hypothetical protein
MMTIWPVGDIMAGWHGGCTLYCKEAIGEEVVSSGSSGKIPMVAIFLFYF